MRSNRDDVRWNDRKPSARRCHSPIRSVVCTHDLAALCPFISGTLAHRPLLHHRPPACGMRFSRPTDNRHFVALSVRLLLRRRPALERDHDKISQSGLRYALRLSRFSPTRRDRVIKKHPLRGNLMLSAQVLSQSGVRRTRHCRCPNNSPKSLISFPFFAPPQLRFASQISITPPPFRTALHRHIL